MNIKIQSSYIDIYNNIKSYIENNKYVIFEGPISNENRKKLYVSQKIGEEQTISLYESTELETDEQPILKNIENKDDFLFFYMIINGFKEDYFNLNEIEKNLIFNKLKKDKIQFYTINNLIVIGIHKDLI